ncbi:hypothetical protein BDY19DRAFT_962061 [Irpex rosettiformis]|uniref:Uncharacterized protein n=1 Tax=Irpex rosettiformis TaxID=378272 RepID=A0ACB8TW07_9APHY|nr:hypothetical protein BDY19DRAFT_962061 [Irpex rosettiformis]
MKAGPHHHWATCIKTRRDDLIEQHSHEATAGNGLEHASEASLSSAVGVVNQHSAVETTGGGQSRKRRSDAEATFAVKHIARRAKLTDKDSALLAAYSKLSSEDQTLSVIALNLKLLTKLNTIQPANTVFIIPELLKNKIEIYVRNAMLCPTTTGYLEDLVRTVMEILRLNPAWGLTRDIQDNECHSKVVHDRVSTRATEKRRAIKVMIAQSVGVANQNDPQGQREGSTNIITLVKNVAGLKGDAIFKTQDIALTIQMLARFSLLRLIYLEMESTREKRDYWTVVDKHLKDIRNSYKDKSKESLSAFFKEILDDDLEKFGHHPDIALEDLDSTNLSRAQRETEDAMAGIINISTDDEDGEE